MGSEISKLSEKKIFTLRAPSWLSEVTCMKESYWLSTILAFASIMSLLFLELNSLSKYIQDGLYVLTQQCLHNMTHLS